MTLGTFALLVCGCGARATSGASIAEGGQPPTSEPPSAPDSGAATGPDDGGSEANDASTTPNASCTTDSIFAVISPTRNPGSGGNYHYILEAFHPGSGETTVVGPLECVGLRPPIDGLAVDRSGTFYASNVEGVYRVEAVDGGYSCTLSNLLASQGGPFQPLGIGFARTSATEESLFASFLRGTSGSFSQPVGVVSLDGGMVEVSGDGGQNVTGGLTGTSDGRLFAVGSAGKVLQIDPVTGTNVAEFPFSIAPSYALPPLETQIAFWTGDFYTFTEYVGLVDGGFDPNAGILRLRPSDGTVQLVGEIDGAVFGAAVSTCAPLQ